MPLGADSCKRRVCTLAPSGEYDLTIRARQRFKLLITTVSHTPRRAKEAAILAVILDFTVSQRKGVETATRMFEHRTPKLTKTSFFQFFYHKMYPKLHKRTHRNERRTTPTHHYLKRFRKIVIMFCIHVYHKTNISTIILGKAMPT